VNLVTGATGFLGSHIVERLVMEGSAVRVLVRPTSDTRFLDRLPVEKVVGDLSNRTGLDRFCEGMDVVYHAAARVSDWGPWAAFQRDTVEATRNLAHAAHKTGVRRFVHISSVGVYAPRRGEGLAIDETSPLGGGDRWSRYRRAKALAEEVLWALHRDDGLPLTVMRPGWIYGPRDTTILPRFHRVLTAGAVRILGDGQNRISAIFVGDMVEACLIAAGNDRAVGQAYNCTGEGVITQQTFVDLWADALGCPRPHRRIPYGVAMSAASVWEWMGRLVGRRTPPLITRYGVRIMGRFVHFPADKARLELGWTPKVSYEEGIRLTAQWYLGHLQGGGK